jgi:DsbC/DsbD-like thiol-disulfide interchange protein
MNRKKASTFRLVQLTGVSLVLSGVALVFGGTADAKAGDKKVPSQVKLTATAAKPDADGRQVITITMNINKDWHAYANPVQCEDLEAVQTTVKIASANKIQVKISYPEGKRNGNGKLTHYIYEGKVEIQAIVTRAPGDTGALEVSVKYVTCNDVTKQCCPLEQVKLQVK